MPVRLFLSSGDLMADRRYEFARDLQLKGDLVAAADLLLQATELAPNFVSAWFTLGQIREKLGERESAIAAFRKAHASDPDDRHGASLRLMRLGAEQVAAMPSAYVQVLFDQYAPRFEAALVGDLGYRGPALLFRAVLFGTGRGQEAGLLQARDRSRLRYGARSRGVCQGGGSFHRH
jgi:predicted TPR repeat methyltransferase